MNAKTFVRLFVVAGLVAWPSYHVYKLVEANQQVATSALLKAKVNQHLASLQAKHLEVARNNKAPLPK